MTLPDHMSCEEYRKLMGATVAEKARPQIRLPDLKGPNATEAEYGRILNSEFPDCDVVYEGISFRLGSGLYSPDWTVWSLNVLALVVEVKGSWIHRDSSLSKFKEARKRWGYIKWRFAQKMKSGEFVTAE